MKLPSLPREPIRPETEDPEFDPEIWQPHWRCFACHDSGMVTGLLARLVIPDYDNDRDKPVACQHPRCEAGKHYRCNLNYDQRFTAAVCAELDRFSREDWRKSAVSKMQRIQEAASELAREKSMRMRHRDTYEEQLATERHRLVVEEDWGLVASAPAEKQWLDGWEGEG